MMTSCFHFNVTADDLMKSKQPNRLFSSQETDVLKLFAVRRTQEGVNRSHVGVSTLFVRLQLPPVTTGVALGLNLNVTFTIITSCTGISFQH